MPTAASSHPSEQAWYREPWPWILMAGPATVVVAGFFTWGLAARTENALVVDNYYKEGLAINQVLDAERNAAAHGYQARVQMQGAGVAVRLTGLGPLPARLRVKFVHPTHAGLDTTLMLQQRAAGEYGADMAGDDDALRDASPRWRVLVEDEGAHWRLTGDWDLRKTQVLELTATSR